MDIEEFVKQVQPRKKRSRLIPFTDQIMRLKTEGYTDLQIRDWLEANGVKVSREMVRKFVAKKSMEPQTERKENSTAPVPAGAAQASEDAGQPPDTKPAISQAEKMRKNLETQKRDAESKRFKHDKTGGT